MNKTLVFDMDGTLVNFYGVEGWLDDLKNENARPYIEGEPLYKPSTINKLVKRLKDDGWHIVITTWLAKGSSREFDKKVRAAKLEWLDKTNFPYDEIHLVKYGTTKANCTRKRGGIQVLVDDNNKVRSGWSLGHTIDANKNIIPELEKLLEKA